MDALNVMIADDELYVRTVLRSIVNRLPGRVVGEVETGKDVFEIYSQLLPDLLLLDINMPLKTGDMVIEELIATHPEARIIMLTGVADSETVEKCIAAGACGYIRKDTAPEEMKEMILSIMAG